MDTYMDHLSPSSPDTSRFRLCRLKHVPIPRVIAILFLFSNIKFSVPSTSSSVDGKHTLGRTHVTLLYGGYHFEPMGVPSPTWGGGSSPFFSLCEFCLTVEDCCRTGAVVLLFSVSIPTNSHQRILAMLLPMSSHPPTAARHRNRPPQQEKAATTRR